MKEMVAGCCVCSDERGWTENPLVYCDGVGCNIAVHQACYGITSVPSGNWYCRKCECLDRTARVRCELCPFKDGALKRTDNGGWAHVVCGLYIPEVRFASVTTMEPIILSQIPSERFNKVCYICEQNNRGNRASLGACMQCNKAGCKQQFHVTCAQALGLLCEEAGNYLDNVKYCGYCQDHYMKLKKGSNIKTIPPYRPISNNNSGSEESPDKKNASTFQNACDTKPPPAKRKSVLNKTINQNGANTNTTTVISSSVTTTSTSSINIYSNTTTVISSSIASTSTANPFPSLPISVQNTSFNSTSTPSNSFVNTPVSTISFPNSPVQTSSFVSTPISSYLATNAFTETNTKSNSNFQSGVSAPHMLGNQLNPSSSMAQKMSDTLNDELEAHSIFTNADSNDNTNNFIGPPLYNKILTSTRTADASKRSSSPSNGPFASLSSSSANFPQTLEELLETQWEQGGTFLMEQAQHFDIASLLTCLHKLKEENLGLEDHIRKLKARRDYLLGVNARLAMPLAPISQRTTTPTTTTTTTMKKVPTTKNMFEN